MRSDSEKTANSVPFAGEHRVFKVEVARWPSFALWYLDFTRFRLRIIHLIQHQHLSNLIKIINTSFVCCDAEETEEMMKAAISAVQEDGEIGRAHV